MVAVAKSKWLTVWTKFDEGGVVVMLGISEETDDGDWHMLSGSTLILPMKMSVKE